MPYRVILGLREGCPWCVKMRGRLDAMREVLDAVGAELRIVGPDAIPKNVSDRFPGVPICMCTDENGSILVDKSLVGYMYSDDVPGTQRFMRTLARWLLALRTNDI